MFKHEETLYKYAQNETNTDAYSEPGQTSKMEHFVKIVYDYVKFFFAKCLILMFDKGLSMPLQYIFTILSKIKTVYDGRYIPQTDV